MGGSDRTDGGAGHAYPFDDEFTAEDALKLRYAEHDVLDGTAWGEESEHDPVEYEGPGSAWFAALGTIGDLADQRTGSVATVVGSFVDAKERFSDASQAYGMAYLRTYQGSEDLRTRARDWELADEAAEKADLAVAVISLGSGARNAVRFLAKRRAAARLARETAEAAARSIDDAERIINSIPELAAVLEDLGQHRNQLIDLVVAARRHGFDDIGPWLASQGELIVARGHSVAENMPALFRATGIELARLKGWVRAADDVVEVLNGALVGGRSVLGGVKSLTPAQARAFVRLVDETPGFWELLPRYYDEIGWASTTPFQEANYFALAYHAEDITFLRTLYRAITRSADDLSDLGVTLRAMLGRTKSAAVGAASSADDAVRIPSTAAAFAASAGPAGAGTVVGATALLDDDPVVVSDALGGFEEYFGEFGIVDGDEVEVLGLSDHGYLSGLWGLVSEPITTTTALWYTAWGQAEWATFREEYADELAALGPALGDAAGALAAVQHAVEGAALDDPDSLLGGGGVAAWREALDELDAAWERAPQGWRDTYEEEYRLRRAGILREIRHLEQIADGLRAVRDALPALAAQLDERRDGGDIGALDPGLAVLLVQIGLMLEGASFDVVASDREDPEAQPPSWEEIERMAEEQAARYDELRDIPDYDPLAEPGGAAPPPGATPAPEPEPASSGGGGGARVWLFAGVIAAVVALGAFVAFTLAGGSSDSDDAAVETADAGTDGAEADEGSDATPAEGDATADDAATDEAEEGAEVVPVAARIDADPLTVPLSDGRGRFTVLVDPASGHLLAVVQLDAPLAAGECVLVRSELVPSLDPALLGDPLRKYTAGAVCEGPVVPPDIPRLAPGDDVLICGGEFATLYIVDLGLPEGEDGRTVGRVFGAVIGGTGIPGGTAVVMLPDGPTPDAATATVDDVAHCE